MHVFFSVDSQVKPQLFCTEGAVCLFLPLERLSLENGTLYVWLLPFGTAIPLLHPKLAWTSGSFSILSPQPSPSLLVLPSEKGVVCKMNHLFLDLAPSSLLQHHLWIQGHWSVLTWKRVSYGDKGWGGYQGIELEGKNSILVLTWHADLYQNSQCLVRKHVLSQHSHPSSAYSEASKSKLLRKCKGSWQNYAKSTPAWLHVNPGCWMLAHVWAAVFSLCWNLVTRK